MITDSIRFVVDRNGKVRDAGTLGEDGGRLMEEARLKAEADLYYFTKYILGRSYLTDSLHWPICQWLQSRSSMRKLLLLPREHAKTSMVSHGLPIHILLQPADNNIYVPGIDGAECRILLACEAESRATDHIRVVESVFEQNTLIRALWPDKCWRNPRRDAKRWNDREFILPRRREFPDPSVRGIGVGGAITGARPNILIKDDLISIEAANSAVVMQTAIQWHVASRALQNAADSREFIIGTRWAVNDLYQHIIDNDPSVEVIVRSVVEGGLPIYPELFTLQKIAQLRREFGTLFPLLYMNSAADPDLVDFDIADIREFTIAEGYLDFAELPQDAAFADRLHVPLPRDEASLRGVPLNESTYDRLLGGFKRRRGRVRS